MPVGHGGIDLVDALDGLRGNVTDFLEDLVGEPVYAEKLTQFETVATAPNRLSVRAGHPLAFRVTILRGCRSARPYLYAETLLVASRLPPTAAQRLATSGDPIGRVIADHGLAVTRSDVAPIAELSPCRFPDEVAGWVHARRYLIHREGRPVMEISEWFLPALDQFLHRPT